MEKERKKGKKGEKKKKEEKWVHVGMMMFPEEVPLNKESGSGFLVIWKFLKYFYGFGLSRGNTPFFKHVPGDGVLIISRC